jgi:hypothetical protein
MVELETAPVMKEAIGLYERYGFRRFHSSHLSSRVELPLSIVDSAGHCNKCED